MHACWQSIFVGHGSIPGKPYLDHWQFHIVMLSEARCLTWDDLLLPNHSGDVYSAGYFMKFPWCHDQELLADQLMSQFGCGSGSGPWTS